MPNSDARQSGATLAKRALRILQVSTSDTLGGAERVAWNLLWNYHARGHDSWLAVGHKSGNHSNVLILPNQDHRDLWSRFCRHAYSDLQTRLPQLAEKRWVKSLAHVLADPGKTLDSHRGIEDFRFPGTWQLLKLTGRRPDIVHCHNLHGGYFDLRALPWLSWQVPLVLTLHDAWLLGGHCAHSLGCERWMSGCGLCPDLALSPPIRQDATAHNWRRKRGILKKSRLYVATPSRWLMQKVEKSMLTAAIAEARVIPNGVDLSVFHAAPRSAVREALGIRQDALVVLFTAFAVRRNMWKDYQTVQAAIALLSERLQERSLVFVVLGEDSPVEKIGQAEVRFIPHQESPEAVACYYQASDAYVHASRADTFPNAVLEALACGTPVVATAVGGIPEQVEDGRTGFLVPPGDVQALTTRLGTILSDASLHRSLSTQAAAAARHRFDLRRQVDVYLDWYNTLASYEGLEPVPGED